MKNTTVSPLSLGTFALVSCVAGAANAAQKVALGDLNISKISVGYGAVGHNKSVDGKPLSIGGRRFDAGLGVHATSGATLQLDGRVTRFSALVGVDDEVAKEGEQRGSVEFLVAGDGKMLWRSGQMRAGDAAKTVDVDLTGVRELRLVVSSLGDIAYDHADWAQAQFQYEGAAPQLADAPRETAVILTPRTRLTPRINGARVFGARPGAPFFYPVAATGQKPLSYSAQGLPAGLSLDPQSGLITGRVGQKGSYRATVTVSNVLGRDTRPLRIEIGQDINLTPPMGWNSWYRYSESVSQQNVLETARAMKASGLADHGWSYINIDDCWQGERVAPNLALQANAKFPDMKAMCDQIHALGLRAGLYSTPWISSYAGFRGGSSPNADGTYPIVVPPEKQLQPDQIFGRAPGYRLTEMNHVGEHWFFDRDAKQIADWGFDYIKMDWAGPDVPTTERIESDLLKTGRDITLSLSNSAPLDRAPQLSALAQVWRTTGDIHDNWPKVSSIAEAQQKWAPFTKPGHWNDPDMLQVGVLGVPNAFNAVGKPSGLTPNEQYSQVSLWSLFSAPLILSCDINALDDFTKSLLTNDEVLEVNQDPMGAPARLISDGDARIWSKPLEDGSMAVGLFNFGELEQEISVNFADLKVDKPQRVRDLWRQTDVGTQAKSFSARVPRHGVMLVRLSAAGG